MNNIVEEGASVGQRDFQFSDSELAKLKKHTINLRDGRFIQSGSYSTSPSDVEDLFNKHIKEAYHQKRNEEQDFNLLFFAHGGTVSEKGAIQQALAHIDYWLDAGIYPVFFIWETEIWRSIGDNLRGRPKDRGLFDSIGESFLNATDWTIEKAVRLAQIDHVWARMKSYAANAVEPGRGGASKVAVELTKVLDLDEIDPVSYTHLTLPTIYSV